MCRLEVRTPVPFPPMNLTTPPTPRGHCWLSQDDTTLGMLFSRWFYLREGDTAIARGFGEWVYLREGSHWIARLFGHLYITSCDGRRKWSWRWTSNAAGLSSRE